MKYSAWFGMDTENDDKGVVTLVAMVKENGERTVWRRAGRFREWCENNNEDNPVVVCHNLEYDLVNEFGDYYPFLSLTYLHGRLITAKYKNVTFIDSFNHYRMSLAKVGDAFGIKKLAFDINSVDYVCTDAYICLKAMTFTRDYIESLGGELGSTAGSSAMSVWRAMSDDEWLLGPFDNPWLRKGYYGGRTEIFRRRTAGKPFLDADGQIQTEEKADGTWKMKRHEDIRGYDVNSMYPFCMMGDFPVMWGEDPTMKKVKGMAEITVKVPTDQYVGPLVYRDEHQRLVYPVGIFRGIWTYDEIRYAESLGATVMQVHKGVGGNVMDKPFRHYVNTIYKKRKESTNQAEREALKVILNSLYGKLAARNVVTRVVSKYNLLKSGSKRINDVQWINGHRGLLDFFTPQPKYVNVLWGAMITANARVLLTKYLRMVDPEKLVYCDTDSIYVHDTELPLSTELGGLKLEKTAKEMDIYQPKVYRLDDAYKAKGVPKPKRDADGKILMDYAKAYMEEGLAEFQAPIRFRESLKSKRGTANQWIDRKKSMKTIYAAKSLSGDRYFPPVIGQQQELLLTVTDSKGKTKPLVKR